MSKYKLVNNNIEIKRESIHIYLPEMFYKQLKAMHHDMNYYSIAQLLRRMLRFFLGLMKLYGKRSIEELKTILKEWNKRNGDQD